MLVTDVGGLAELIPDGVVGYVVPPTPAAIADAVVDFYARQREEEFTVGGAQAENAVFVAGDGGGAQGGGGGGCQLAPYLFGLYSS